MIINTVPVAYQILIVFYSCLVSVFVQPKTSFVELQDENIELVNNKYTIQLGAFSNLDNAVHYMMELDIELPQEYFVQQDKSNQLFRLNVGFFESEIDGKSLLKYFKSKGIDCFIRLL